MKRILILLLASMAMSGALHAQHMSLLATEAKLRILTDTVLGSHNAERRLEACAEAEGLLAAVLEQPGSFSHPFESLQTMSILQDSAATFRIFTGQLFVNDSTYRYYGGIQLAGDDPVFIPFEDRTYEIEDLEYEILGPEEWPGALYYRMLEYKGTQGKSYILFGYNAYSFFNKRKIMEVLSFEGQRPVFGGPVFVRKDAEGLVADRNRIILTYSADANLACNFDPLENMIVYDHTIEAKGIYPGQGNTQVPDGSYCGYKLEQGLWVFVDKLRVEVMDKPLRASPESSGKKSGLFEASDAAKNKKKRKKP